MLRLDFEYEARIVQTCNEHAELLEANELRDEERALELISLHIKYACSGACNITLSRLQGAGRKPSSGRCRFSWASTVKPVRRANGCMNFCAPEPIGLSV